MGPKSKAYILYNLHFTVDTASPYARRSPYLEFDPITMWWRAMVAHYPWW